METIKNSKDLDDKCLNKKKTYKIKTDTISVRVNLFKEIQPPEYIKIENKGVKKNFKPVNTLKRFTLERVDEVSRSKDPEGENLKYLVQFIKKCRINNKEVNKNSEEDSAANNWSVYSEVHSSNDEAEEEFTKRLNEIGKGNKLKRKSILVPDPISK